MNRSDRNVAVVVVPVVIAATLHSPTWANLTQEVDPSARANQDTKEIRVSAKSMSTTPQSLRFQLRRMRGVSLLSLLALVFAAAPLFAQVPMQSTDRAKTLGNQLMCTCGCGDTAGSCSHPGAAFSGPCDVAKGKLKEMNERIARGESDKTILQAFVQEYGDSALAAPPARGFNWFGYTFPAIAFAIGLALLITITRQWRHRPPQAATASGPAVTPEMLENARSQIKREVQDD